MSRSIALAPFGLAIEHIQAEPSRLVIVARPTSKTAACPTCGATSVQVHGRSQLSLSDLPAHGRRVTIRVWIRRFRCDMVGCGQKTFSERLDATASRPYARRTSRLEGIVHHLGLALGGRPGQNLAQRLFLPVSKDTLLRVVRRHALQPTGTPRAVGIDDWAWKRGHRYGTIICDLERHRIIDLLPDREAATVTAWLAEHPTIKVIARDRGAGYMQAATEGRPEATQVADRWHLMENASAAYLTAVQQSKHAIRIALGIGIVDPKRLTRAERRQHSGWLRRRTRTPPFWHWQRREWRSRTSCGAPAGRASSSVRSCAVAGWMSFAVGCIPSIPSSSSSKQRGRAAAATVPRFGAR
jgi:transposase